MFNRDVVDWILVLFLIGVTLVLIMGYICSLIN